MGSLVEWHIPKGKFDFGILESFSADDEGPIVDLDKFDNGTFIIHPREKEDTSELHEIAAEEIESFLAIKPEVIGLATWDFDEACLRRVFTRNGREGLASKERTKGATPRKNRKLSLKTRFIFMMLAVIVVSGISGYREHEKSGQLDHLWYISSGATIALVLLIFVLLAKRK